MLENHLRGHWNGKDADAMKNQKKYFWREFNLDGVKKSIINQMDFLLSDTVTIETHTKRDLNTSLPQHTTQTSHSTRNHKKNKLHVNIIMHTFEVTFIVS